MSNDIVTKDMSDFGYRELKLAGELLALYKSDKDLTKYLGNGVAVWFNKHSAMVFLCDEDYNTAVIG